MLKELENLRQKIDKIDKKIVELLDDRASVAKKIYLLKRKNNIPVFDVLREDEKISWVQSCVKHFPKDSARKVFVEIFSGTRKLAKDMKVAYLGPEGSFSHLAAVNVFGSSVEFLPEDLSGIFEKVQRSDVDYGVIPIENSRDGLVGETLDLLLESKVKIIYEVSMKVSFCFFSNADSLKNVKRIYSHQKAIIQCSKWIRENLGKVDVVYTSSTSDGAKRAYEDIEGGAIASEEISKIMNFKIFYKDIQDSVDERTDFAIISADEDIFVSPKRKILNPRISFCFSVLDEPGALFKALYPIARRKINMKKIHSRPDKITKRYNFFVEIEEPRNEKIVYKTFEDIKKNSVFFRVFGKYPYKVI
ncbi:chorismate mutase / prephenate dehydratase [Candidatus Kryptobacter tengchongensis]|nr:chorismate mutase / prephenate dehydratase [Candidatus Kryptobacter tengchongensis]